MYNSHSHVIPGSYPAFQPGFLALLSFRNVKSENVRAWRDFKDHLFWHPHSMKVWLWWSPTESSLERFYPGKNHYLLSQTHIFLIWKMGTGSPALYYRAQLWEARALSIQRQDHLKQAIHVLYSLYSFSVCDLFSLSAGITFLEHYGPKYLAQTCTLRFLANIYLMVERRETGRKGAILLYSRIQSCSWPRIWTATGSLFL